MCPSWRKRKSPWPNSFPSSAAEAAQKQGRTITLVDGEDDVRAEMRNRGLQRPRIFYRREADPDPLVIDAAGSTGRRNTSSKSTRRSLKT